MQLLFTALQKRFVAEVNGNEVNADAKAGDDDDHIDGADANIVDNSL